MSREKDEDTPKLSLLLCEALVGVYLCLLSYGLVTCEPAILYRLVALRFTEKEWAALFGGGVKRLVKVMPSIPPHVLQVSGCTNVSIEKFCPGIFRWKHRLQKCYELDGNYVEK